MNDTIFVYWKDGKFEVHDIDAARQFDRPKRDSGWQLVGTLKGSTWIEILLNSEKEDQEAILKEFNEIR